MEDVKTTRLLSDDRCIWGTFDIQIDITLVIFWEKVRSCCHSLQNNGYFFLNEKFVFFGGPFFKMKIGDILNF